MPALLFHLREILELWIISSNVFKICIKFQALEWLSRCLLTGFYTNHLNSLLTVILRYKDTKIK
jgi:hypothetical protein